MTDPYSKLSRDGKVVDALTDGALRRAEKRLGYSLTIVQGSYNPGKVAASAGTHDLGGVVDLMPWDREKKIIALRAVGFAEWYRPAIPGLWSAHIHAVLIGHGRLALSAARQVSAYLARRDGLKGNGPDVDPGWTNTARYTVEAFKADVARAALDVRIEAKRTRRRALLDEIKRLVGKKRSLP
jgi:hypothetical protein